MVVMTRWLLVLAVMAGCGDDDGVHHLADAPLAPDAPADGAASGPVTLTITRDGTGVAAVDVYFQAADGALVAKVATNAAGTASTVMAAGGFVTVANPFDGKQSTDDVRTFAGVKPGDQLELSQRTGAAEITVTLTAPIDAAATQYEVYTTCGRLQTLTGSGGSGTTPTGPITLDACAGGLADFLIVTSDANGAPSQFLFKAGVAVADQGTIDLSAETYTSPVPAAQLTWTNIPAAFTGLAYNHVLLSPRGPLIDMLLATTTTSGMATASVPQPGGIPIAVTGSHPSPTQGVAEHFVIDWRPASATATIDLAGSMLGSYTGAPAYAAGTRTLTWATDAGVLPDTVWATLAVQRGGTTFWEWQMIAPAQGTSLVLPPLPAGLDQYVPIASDSVQVSGLTTIKAPGGYDALRAGLLSSNGAGQFVVGSTGRIAYENLEVAVERPAPRGWSRPRAAATLRR